MTRGVGMLGDVGHHTLDTTRANADGHEIFWLPD